MLSRKKRNIKYYKSHPTSKRPKLSTIEPNTNVEAGEQCPDESSKNKEREQEIVIVSSDRKIFIGTSSNSNHLLNESRATGPFVSTSNITQQLSTPVTAITTSNEASASPHSSRRATISLIHPTSTQLSNVSTINTTPVPNKLPLTTNSTNTFLYVDGRMNLTAAQARPVVAVHKALLPRVANKKINNIPATSNNTTTVAPPNNTTSATTNKESNYIFRSISNDNIDERVTLSNDESMCNLKISKSEQDAYDKDVNRLRSMIKPKDIEFSVKVFQYQEIFHEEALIYDYSLIKNKLFSYEKLENEARALLDGTIHKYSISNEHFLTERDFQAIQKLCIELDESNIVYKNGLTNPHPPIGVLMVPTGTSSVQNVFLFVKNLPYKMNIRVSITGLHKVLALLIIVYVNLNHLPTHKLLLMLMNKSKEINN
ncbi:unnamed protein product [Rotaria magnacalcarata]|uniref:Uncharacterized protein n=3 Tax=Rotaria magnacalcarata TaxID=392030 RepID=A0A815GSL4_9BILA|nr:unnamed protein product [Rotaria magnacalcarata]